jgi:hypothetical protein
LEIFSGKQKPESVQGTVDIDFLEWCLPSLVAVYWKNRIAWRSRIKYNTTISWDLGLFSD